MDDTPYAMELISGSASNGAYRVTTRLDPGPHAYYFHFSFPEGEARLPFIGAFPDSFVDFSVYLPAIQNLYER